MMNTTQTKENKTMTDTQHTPGEWYGKVQGNGQGLVISETDGRSVAVAYDEKDTNLIAAAPKLLEACMLLMTGMQDGSNKGFKEGLEAINAASA